MYEVRYNYKDYDEIDLYLATQSPDNISLKDIEDGTSITVDNVIVWTNDESDEPDREVMSILSGEKVYTFQSNTAQDSMMNILKIIKADSFNVIKFSGKSKSGREYVNVRLDVAKLRADQRAAEAEQK